MIPKYLVFIRKNTKEIRDKLESLGYNNGYVISTDFGLYTQILPKGFEGLEEDVACFYPIETEDDVEDYVESESGYIDCGDNEDIFFGLAAIQDNTDINQWFVLEKTLSFPNSGDLIPEGTFLLSLVDKFDSPDYHKATKEEIIEYFSVKI